MLVQALSSVTVAIRSGRITRNDIVRERVRDEIILYVLSFYDSVYL